MGDRGQEMWGVEARATRTGRWAGRVMRSRSHNARVQWPGGRGSITCCVVRQSSHQVRLAVTCMSTARGIVCETLH